jgi:hypothetical protein
MKVHGTIAGRPLGARLTTLCWAALILLAPVAVSACTSGSSTSTPTVPAFSPTVTTSGSTTVPASSGNTPSSGSNSKAGTPGVTSTATAPAVQTATATVTQTVTAASSASQVPSAAPVTGGGGTAGFQDTLLLGLGAAAILAGAGGIAYRRRLGRRR